jgi:adenylate cyclase
MPAMAATRRLAAILAADVAGYSRLIGADEQRTLERLRAIRTELIDPGMAGHNGRIFKTTGDLSRAFAIPAEMSPAPPSSIPS